MQCPGCGAYITEDDVFCGECGQPLVDLTAASPPGDQPPREAVPPPTIAAAAAPAGRSGRSWIVLGAIVGVGVLLVLGLCIFGALLLWPEPQDEVMVSTAPVGQPLYEDDFSDADSGWDIYDEGDTWAGYWDGGYRMAVFREKYTAWAIPSPSLSLSDFQVEVTAQQIAGPLDNNLGVLVRYQDDDDNFYWFQISSDGYYSVDRRQAGEWITLLGWQESEAINQGLNATNHLKVVCDGDRFTFYVNDVYLTDLTDSTFAVGNIGLAIGTFDEPGVEILFDDIRAYVLSE